MAAMRVPGNNEARSRMTDNRDGMILLPRLRSQTGYSKDGM